MLADIGYTANAYENLSSAITYSYMQSGDIYVFRGHAFPCQLCFYDYTGSITGYIMCYQSTPLDNAYYINRLDANVLGTQRCILYLGCTTGVNKQTYNLVSGSFEKGAHFVLGTTLTTEVSDSNNFLSGFLNGIECGYSIEGCIAQGISQAGDQVPRPDLETGKGTYPIVYVGDTQQYFH